MVSDLRSPARHPVFVRVLPFAVFIAFIVGSGPLERLASAIGMDARWWYAIRILVVAGLIAWLWRGYEELRSITGIRALDWFAAVALGVVVFVLWINLDFTPLAFGSSPGFDPRGGDGAVDWRLALPRLAGAALLVPVIEELFWRSFAMRWIQDHDFLKLLPGRVGLKALGISAVVFGLEHHLWFAGLLAGLAYGWLYIRTGNLWVPILSHAVTNGLLGAWILYTQSWEFW